MELKGTKTEKNLMEAFAGESQARNTRQASSPVTAPLANTTATSGIWGSNHYFLAFHTRFNVPAILFS